MQKLNLKSSESSTISEFYSGRSVFITGATGFLGKVIVEKLLRSCPNVENVFVLMRPKKNQLISERYKDIINVPLFDKLRQENPGQFKKIIPIAGDIEHDGLGISDADRKLLCDKVSITFHSAATVDFEAPLKNAVKANLEATNEILKLCRELKDSQALVHISTTYSSGHALESKEVLYPPTYDPEELIEFAKKMSSDELKKRQPQFLEGYQNTYSFTKALAEVLVTKKAKKENLPVAIVRPSLILGSMEEPMPGWIDNSYGPTAPMIWMSKGIFHASPCKKSAPVPLIPVDMVSNALIAAAWRTALDRKPGTIYNVCSSCRNPITWSAFWEKIEERARKFPLSSNPIWYSTMTLRNSKLGHDAHCFLAHTIPAAIIDGLTILRGKKPENLNAQKKIRGYIGNTRFFISQAFAFQTENLPKLVESMSPKDQVEFKCDPREITWNKYLTDYVLGTRRFLLKKADDTLDMDRMKVARLRPVHNATKYALILLTLALAGGELYRRSKKNRIQLQFGRQMMA